MNVSNLKFKGGAHFRARLVFSVLSGRPVRITGIREMSEQPGVSDEEVSFIRLLDKLTNGTKIKINETGTSVSLTPGFILGGKLDHACPNGRAIGYYLESILPLCAFAKKPVNITFTGVTENDVDISVDTLSSAMIPLLGKFAEELSFAKLQIVKRGSFPGGGGEVVFTCPIVRTSLKAIHFVDQGKVNRIRGTAFATNLSPQIANRMVDSARSILNKFCNDVYIHTDHRRGDQAGAPGYGLSLVAETDTWCKYGTQRTAVRELSPEHDEYALSKALNEYNESRDIEGFSNPEDLGENVAKQLLEEIFKSGVVGTSVQWLALIMMVLCPEDVSKIKFGKVSRDSIVYLRLIRDFFGTEFKIVQDEESSTVLLSCMGVGFRNLSRKVT